MTRTKHDDLFVLMSFDEFCARQFAPSLPRALIERYLQALGRGYALRDGQLLIYWEHLVADLPAFQAYLAHNVIGRPDPEIAARADNITAAIWAYSNSRKTDRRLPQRLHRIRSKLGTLQRRTPPQEVGERVSKVMKDFPYLETMDEFYHALEAVRPDRINRQGNVVTLIHGNPPTVADEISIIDCMIASLTRPGASSRAKLGQQLIVKLEDDHQWLGHKPREQYGSNFGAFVEHVLGRTMTMPEELRTNLVGVAAALIR